MDIVERPRSQGNSVAAGGLYVFVGLALLTALVRAGFVPNVNNDEAFYLIIGRQWLHGSLPYVGSFDVKPPGLFAAMAAAEAIFGAKIWAAKAVEIAAVTATSFGLWLIGRRFLGAAAGLVAAVLYIVSSLTLGGTGTPAPLLAAPFTTFGMAITLPSLVDRVGGRLSPLFAAGLLFGIAVTINHSPIFEAGALVLAVLTQRSNPARLRMIGAFAAGFAACPLVFLLLYLAAGHLDALIAAVIRSGAERVAGDNISWTQATLRLLPMMKPIAPVALMSAVVWAECHARRDLAIYPTLRLLAYWFGGALLGVLAVRSMYDHYDLPLLQPLCLASGVFATSVTERISQPIWRWASRVAALTIAVGYTAWNVAPLFLADQSTQQAVQNAAGAIIASGLKPDDRILVVNRGLSVYLATGAEPPTAIFHPQHLLCDFPLATAANPLSDALASAPAFIVVADPNLRMACERDDRHALLDATLARDYCPVAQISGATAGGKPDPLAIYGLRRRFSAKCLPASG
jgi:hypothetical protein